MSKSNGSKPQSERPSLVPVMLKLSPEDRDALQQEALRRRIAGQTTRMDMSAIVRGLIAKWRAAELRP
jgi:hypothetical protein